MTSKAELTVRSANSKVILGSLSPELGEMIPRTKVEIESNGNEIKVKIEADDHNALRAALNSYIRWMNVADETANEAVRE